MHLGGAFQKSGQPHDYMDYIRDYLHLYVIQKNIIKIEMFKKKNIEMKMINNI